ncbi:FldA protein [Streptomyces purpurascens]
MRVEGGVGADLAHLPAGSDRVRLEHPTGFLDIECAVGTDTAGRPVARRTAVVRTARKIFDGTVFPAPAHPLKDSR